MSNCDGIRISQLPVLDFVGAGDYVVINDNNAITKRISFNEFIDSINSSPGTRLTTYAKDVLLVSPGGQLNPLWNKYPGSLPSNQDSANDKFLAELARQNQELVDLNVQIIELQEQDGRYATKSYVDQQILLEKTAREGADDVLMNIKADKYNHYTKAEIDQMLDEIIIGEGSVPEAPETGLQYGRQNKQWTEIQAGITEAPLDGKEYVRKLGDWAEASDGVTNLGLDEHGARTLDITSSTGTDVTIPAASNVLAGLMTAEDKVKLGNVAGTDLNIINRDEDSFELTSSTGDDVLVPAVTTSFAGLMTAADKVALNSAVASGGVAGTNGMVQFNNAGVMGASAGLVFTAGSDTLTISQSVEIKNGLVAVKTTTGNPGAIDLYCEVGNAHRVRLQSPNHGSYTGNLTFTLPSSYPNAGEVLTASATGVMSWTTIPPGYSDDDVDAHLNSASATSGQVLSWTGATYNWITPFDGDYNSLDNLPTIPPAYGDADVDAHLNKNTANQDQVLSWNGTDYEWQTPATSMNFQGTVDLTDGSTVPAGPDSDGDTYTNTGTGTIAAAWVTASDQVGGTAVSAGDLVIYNTDDSLYHYVPTGGTTPPTDLAVANKTATTLDITSSTGADATVPAVTSTEAGLMTAADKVSLDNLAGATDYGDDDVEALFQAYDFHLLPGTNATYDIGSAEKKVRHLFLSDNSLRFVTDGDIEYPLSVDAPNLFFNSKQVAMVEDIKGGDISTDDNPPATPEDGDLWFNPNTGTLYIYYTDDNSSQWVEIAGPGGEAGDGASVTVSPNPPVGEQGDLWFNSNDGSLYIFYADSDSAQWIAIASSGGAGGDGASVSVQPGPPSTPAQGDLWWNTNDGYLYVYYEDGNSNQWVTASPPSEGGGGSGETPDLQAVTDEGRFTTTAIDIGNVSGDPNIHLGSDGAAIFKGLTAFPGGCYAGDIANRPYAYVTNSGTVDLQGSGTYVLNGGKDGDINLKLRSDGGAEFGGNNIVLNADGSGSFAGGAILLNDDGTSRFNTDSNVVYDPTSYTDGSMVITNLDTTNASYAGIRFLSGSTGTGTSGITSIREGSQQTSLAFITSNTTNSDGHEVARLTSQGSLEIGGTPSISPNIQLNADGSARFINGKFKIDGSDSSPTALNFTTHDAAGWTGLQTHHTDDTLHFGLYAFDSGGAAIDNNTVQFWNYLDADMVFATNNLLRMKIKNNGDVFFADDNATITADGKIRCGSGTTTSQTNGQVAIFNEEPTTGVAGLTILDMRSRGGAETTILAEFFRQDYYGPVGKITSDGSSTTYETTSDYRLKENVVGITDAAERVKQLKPSRFNFISSPSKTVDGFLAHEVQSVVPEAVSGEKDAVDKDDNPKYQGIDQSKLVPLLTAALQEALGRIETLEAEVAALKAE